MKFQLLTILAAGCLLAADDPPAEAKKKALKELQGEWNFEWIERDGQRTALARGSLFIRGDRWGRAAGKEFARFEIDPTTDPRVIDVTQTVEPNKGSQSEGIYRIEGDTLTCCFRRVEGVRQRPTEFKTAPGSGLVMWKLKRVKRP